MSEEMQRVRGYRDIRKNDEVQDLYAFLSVFHPEMSEKDKVELAKETMRDEG